MGTVTWNFWQIKQVGKTYDTDFLVHRKGGFDGLMLFFESCNDNTVTFCHSATLSTCENYHLAQELWSNHTKKHAQIT